jgi:hypothetical protein
MKAVFGVVCFLSGSKVRKMVLGVLYHSITIIIVWNNIIWFPLPKLFPQKTIIIVVFLSAISALLFTGVVT